MSRTVPLAAGKRRCVLRWLIVAVLCPLVVGCGAEKYQQRLAETVEYFEYKDIINRDLGPEWSGSGIKMRAPEQFQLISPPAVPEAEEGAAFDDPIEDHRQPHYLGIELPGLVGAWKATIQTDTDDSEAGRTAYLYVLSNYDRYLQPPDERGMSVDPLSFMTEAENQITGAIGVVLPEGNTGSGAQQNTRYLETIPRGLPNSKFRSGNEFTAIRLVPEFAVTDVPLEMQLYEWIGSKMQVAVLMVYPAAVNPQEDLQKRLLLALETFSASDQPPRLSGSGSNSPRPSGPRGAF